MDYLKPMREFAKKFFMFTPGRAQRRDKFDDVGILGLRRNMHRASGYGMIDLGRSWAVLEVGYDGPVCRGRGQTFGKRLKEEAAIRVRGILAALFPRVILRKPPGGPTFHLKRCHSAAHCSVDIFGTVIDW